MSDVPIETLNIREQIARIDRDIAEQAKLREGARRFAVEQAKLTDEGRKFAAEQAKLIDEAYKLLAEGRKLNAEQVKLDAEARKIRRDYFYAPALAIVAVFGGLIGLLSFLKQAGFL